jgi:hypothetical protein
MKPFYLFSTVFLNCIFTSICLQENSTNIGDECNIWKDKYVYFAKDVHFSNQTFPFVKIDTLNDLNVTIACSPTDYSIIPLEIFANQNILFENDLDLRGVLQVFNMSHIQTDLWFKNVMGFNEKSRGLTGEKDDILSETYSLIRSFKFSNVIFDFYQQGKLITSDECKRENFNSKTNFLGHLKMLILLGNVYYNNKICPYVFINTKLERLYFYEISNSLLLRNRVEFLNTTKTNIDNNLNYFLFSIYIDSIALTNLNPFAFRKLKYLIVKGNLEFFDENLFENFNEISFISVRSDDLINFFHRGTKWLNSINKNLNITLSSMYNPQFIKNIHRLVSIELDVQSWLYFNRFYTFPNEDICLFKNFPHTQLVLPLMIFDAKKYVSTEYSCTLVWLKKYYRLYFSNDFTEFNRYVYVQPEYREMFVNESLLVREGEFSSCNFSELFEKCSIKTQYKIVPLNGMESLILYLKWFQNVIEVYMRTFLCFIGLITNFLTLKVIATKKHAKNFSNSIYKHIFANALFNVFYCVIFLFSLLNICIYPKTSFCSSVWQNEFAQYFYIYVILFLGNTFRLCCNISYIFFSVSRFALSGASKKSKLRKFIEKQNIKRFYIVIFILALGFSVFLVFENKVNKLFQDYAGLDFGNFAQNNAYDVKYCENFRSELMTRSVYFSFTSSFYVNCEIFKWLNLVNNILNNGVFLIISVLVDIFMIRYSNKVIETKKSLKCPHLNEALQYKTKLNKMIITNGTLYFLSHFPEFIVTLIFYFLKSDEFTSFCYITFDCTSIIEMAQAFHFISIGFQFFIFLTFDQNFKIFFSSIAQTKKIIDLQ